MKWILRISFLVLAIELAGYSQTIISSTSVTTSTPFSGSATRQINSGTQYHQITWNDSGTVATCSVRIDSSADGVTFNSGDVIAAQTCTSNGSSAIIQGVFNYIRINVTTLSGGGTVNVVYQGYATLPLANGGTINPGMANGKCMADQQVGANLGAKIAACITALPNGGFIDATGLSGAQTITSTVTVGNAGTFVQLAPNVQISTSACPAFDLTAPATTLWGWNSSGPTIIDSVGTQIKYSGSGCSGTPLLRINVNAGIRSAKILGIELDCNLKSANVSAGLSIGGSSAQDNRNVIEDVSITQCTIGFLFVAGAQSTRILRPHTQFVNTAVDLSAGNMRDIGFSACRFVADTLPVLIGTDDNVAGNQSAGIHFTDDCDLTLNNNGTGLMLVRNAQNVEWGSGWGEVTTGKTITQNAAVQIGTASSVPQGVSIHNVRFQMNGNAGQNVTEIVGGFSHSITFNTVNNNAANTYLVLNTSGASASVVFGNQSGYGTNNTPCSSLTFLLTCTGNSTVANDSVIFGMGIKTNNIGTTSSGSVMDLDATNGTIRVCRNSATSCQFQVNQFNTLNAAFTVTSTLAKGLAFGSFTANGPNSANCLFCLASAEQILWRNNANGADIALAKNVNDVITYNSVPVQYPQYNTASASVNANIPATTMVTAPATNASCPTNLTANCTVYEINWYIDLSAVGTSCTGNTTVVLNFLYTDPLGAGQQTVATSTITIATGGNGTLGTLVANGTQIVVAKLSTTVQYSTTSFTAGTGCSPAPKYQVTPIVKQLS